MFLFLSFGSAALSFPNGLFPLEDRTSFAFAISLVSLISFQLSGSGLHAQAAAHPSSWRRVALRWRRVESDGGEREPRGGENQVLVVPNSWQNSEFLLLLLPLSEVRY